MPLKQSTFLIVAGLMAVLLISLYYNGTGKLRKLQGLLAGGVDADIKGLSFQQKVLVKNLSMDDPEVLENIKKAITHPHDPRERVLKPTFTGDNSRYGHSAFVNKLLKNRTGGFFIECGAFNGEDYSNSIYFEAMRN